MHTTFTLPPRYDMPPLARLETAWSPPWLIAQVAQHGVGHFQKGAPMDDSHSVGAAAGSFWMIAGDGVGSQPNSRHGSRIACRAVEHFIGQALIAGKAPSRQLLSDAFAVAADAVRDIARTRGHDPITYATTLSAVVIRGNSLYAASLGDSGIAIATAHEGADGQQKVTVTPMCSATQPPIAGSTYTLAHPDWKQFLATNETHSPHVITVIVATDGANTFFLEPHENGEHRFDASWPAVLEDRLNALGPLKFVNLFAYFIDTYESENFDDRTLLVAYRPPAHLAPPLKGP